MNLRGKKNTSALQPSKKARKPRKSNTKQIISPKLKTLVDQFTNITSSMSFRNEMNISNNKDVSGNNISMGQEQQSVNDLNLHLTSNSFEMMHASDLDTSVLPLSSQEPTPLINSTQILKSTQFPSLREPGFI